MIVNINARQCTDGSIYVQYQEDGKAKDAALPDWKIYVEWLKRKLDVRTSPKEDGGGAGHRDGGGPGF